MERVLQVVGTMDLGGAETFLMNIYRNVDREKVQFDFLCHNRTESKYAAEIERLGGRMFCIPGMSHVGFFRYQRNLYAFFKAHPEYRVVHSHQNELGGIILKQAKRAGVQKRIAHSHTVYPGKSLSYRLRLWIFRQYFRNNVTHPLACSVPAGLGLYRGTQRRTFRTIPNVIDVEKFRFSEQQRTEKRAELGLKDGLVLGHVGRFAPVKNHKKIIEVFHAVWKRQPNATLVLVGEGELFASVQEQAKACGLSDSVRFLGARTDVSALMSAWDVLLFPSINEGLPVTVVEAQAAGLKVVTSDRISEDTVITDRIFRVPLMADAEEWADVVLHAWGETERSCRTCYADAVRAKGFDAVQTASEFERLYLEEK